MRQTGGPITFQMLFLEKASLPKDYFGLFAKWTYIQMILEPFHLMCQVTTQPQENDVKNDSYSANSWQQEMACLKL